MRKNNHSHINTASHVTDLNFYWAMICRAQLWHVKSPIWLSVTLVYTDHIVVNYSINNWTNITLGSSLQGGKEAQICFQGIIPKIPGEIGV